MTRPTGPGDPDLDRIPAALVRRGAQFVVIGIWAVDYAVTVALDADLIWHTQRPRTDRSG